MLFLIGFTTTTAAWGQLTIWLYSTGDLKFEEKLPFMEITPNESNKRKLQGQVVAMMFFIVLFLTASEFVVSLSTCNFYFGRKGNSAISTIYTTIRYHLGSIVLASTYHTFAWLLKILVDYTVKQMKRSNRLFFTDYRASAGVMKFVLCTVTLLSTGLLKFVAYMNSYTLTQVAISSENYHPASVVSGKLIRNNHNRFGILGFVGGLMYGFCRLVIVVFAVYLSFWKSEEMERMLGIKWFEGGAFEKAKKTQFILIFVKINKLKFF